MQNLNSCSAVEGRCSVEMDLGPAVSDVFLLLYSSEEPTACPPGTVPSRKWRTHPTEVEEI